MPATAQSAKGGQGKSNGKAKSGQGKAKSCAKTHSRGFEVGGTLVSFTADDVATTDASEATVTLTVTSANKHARESGELPDMDAAKKGAQAKGATYTVAAGDAFELKLGDDGTAVPAAGDRVKVKGRIAITKKRCAAEGTSVADRYAAPDVTRVKVSKPEVEPAETETAVPPAAQPFVLPAAVLPPCGRLRPVGNAQISDRSTPTSTACGWGAPACARAPRRKHAGARRVDYTA